MKTESDVVTKPSAQTKGPKSIATGDKKTRQRHHVDATLQSAIEARREERASLLAVERQRLPLEERKLELDEQQGDKNVYTSV